MELNNYLDRGIMMLVTFSPKDSRYTNGMSAELSVEVLTKLPTGCKLIPILKPLKDLMRNNPKTKKRYLEEMAQIEIQTPSENFIEIDEFFTDPENNCVGVQYQDRLGQNLLLINQDDGDITCMRGGFHDSARNQIAIFNYLMDNGFDIDGWIKKGLAIDINIEEDVVK